MVNIKEFSLKTTAITILSYFECFIYSILLSTRYHGILIDKKYYITVLYLHVQYLKT